jgi:leucyl aminopeptidase
VIETQIELTRKDVLSVPADAAILFLCEGFDEAIDGLEAEAAKTLVAALRRRKFEAGLASTELVEVPAGRTTRLVVACGLGRASQLDVAKLQKAAAAATRRVTALKPGTVAAALPDADGMPEALDDERRAWAALTGLMLGGYRFEEYVTEESRLQVLPETLIVAVGDAHGPAQRALAHAEAVVDGAVVARDLVNEPAGVLNPEIYAKRVQKLAKQLDLEAEVLSRPAIEKLEMRALLEVAKGSDIEPRVVHLVSRPGGGGRPKARVVLVGKGVTFDTGGYNIKGSGNMETMKCDMAGSAAVVGAMVALAHLEPNVEVHGLIGLVENMISGRAYRPSDVLVTRSGKTVEVMNTDAEGRLVLADLLDYACDELHPDVMVDLATLTGACVVALGPMATGVMSDHEPLRERVLAAAERAGEMMWPLPLYADYREQLKSPVADMKNVGNRWGGALTAGLFLKEFVKGDVPWVHLDIAGPAFRDSDHPFWGRGGTAAGVATLVELVGGLERRALGAGGRGGGRGRGRGRGRRKKSVR